MQSCILHGSRWNLDLQILLFNKYIFGNPQKESTRQFVRNLRVLEYPINSKDFDFIGFNTKIEEFGRKHRISQKTIFNLQLYIEEMFMQIIIPQIKNKVEALVKIEYSDEKDAIDVVIKYCGESFDPMNTENDLSLLIAKKSTEQIKYSFDSSQKLSNKVEAQII